MASSDSRDDLSDFGSILFPSLDDYKKTLPRRKKQTVKDDFCGLSSISWIILFLAFLQGEQT